MYDAIILGAGAAGLMCALTAGQRGRRVLLVDHADAPGKKILISGGGRCNFTNIGTAPDRYLSQPTRISSKSALAPLHRAGFPRPWSNATASPGTKRRWASFSATAPPARSSTCCSTNAHRAGSRSALGKCPRSSVATMAGALPAATAQRGGAPALVLATGGPSIPSWARPASPMTSPAASASRWASRAPRSSRSRSSGEEALFRELSGVSTEVIAGTGKARFREAALFTHRGLSGPAILQVSELLAAWRKRSASTFCPMPSPAGCSPPSACARASTLRTVAGRGAAARLADALAEKLALPTELANTPDSKLEDAAARRLADWHFPPAGTEGFAKAEVTIGGIEHRRPLVADDGGAQGCPASTRSARQWTSPAGSAATISNGPGRAARRGASRFSVRHRLQTLSDRKPGKHDFACPFGRTRLTSPGLISEILRHFPISNSHR